MRLCSTSVVESDGGSMLRMPEWRILRIEAFRRTWRPTANRVQEPTPGRSPNADLLAPPQLVVREVAHARHQLRDVLVQRGLADPAVAE